MQAIILSSGSHGGEHLHRYSITPLGDKINALGVDPNVGKAVIYGLIFGCYNSMAALAAIISYKSPFVKSNDKGLDAQIRRAKLNLARMNDQPSDLLAGIRAYEGYQHAYDKKQYCWDNYLDATNMNMINKIVGDMDNRVKQFFPNSDSIPDVCNSFLGNAQIETQILSSVLLPNVLSFQLKTHLETGATVQVGDESVFSAREMTSGSEFLTYAEMLKIDDSKKWLAFELNPLHLMTLCLFQKADPNSRVLQHSFFKGQYKFSCKVPVWRTLCSTQKMIMNVVMKLSSDMKNLGDRDICEFLGLVSELITISNF